jgi:serine/threonine-protein kinase
LRDASGVAPKERPESGPRPRPTEDDERTTAAVPTCAPIPFGRYELLQCIAAGGMGEVFLARERGEQGFDEVQVIKVLLPHLVKDPEFVRLFLDEARIAAQLNHPNIAAIHDLGRATAATSSPWSTSTAKAWRPSSGRPGSAGAGAAEDPGAHRRRGRRRARLRAPRQGPAGRPLHVIHRDISPRTSSSASTAG